MSELPFVKCDNCKKYFFIQCQERTIEYDIVETFFKCPHCKKEYHCYYDDSKTKQIKNRISREKERWYRTRDQTILKTINKVINISVFNINFFMLSPFIVCSF